MPLPVHLWEQMPLPVHLRLIRQYQQPMMHSRWAWRHGKFFLQLSHEHCIQVVSYMQRQAQKCQSCSPHTARARALVKACLPQMLAPTWTMP